MSVPDLRALPDPLDPKPGALTDCLDTYRRWLHLEDDGQVLFALAVVAGNLLPTDPIWGLEVGAPSGGKTETISPLASLPYVHPAATITEAALLSGTSAKEREKGSTGGLLRQVGDFGVLLLKDFTSVLSMHHEARAAALSALREVYDGSWDRPVGTGGGRVLSWRGKCGILGAVTPTIDRHHAVMGALGERFVLYRLPPVDPRAQSRRRLANRGQEARMRGVLAEAATAVLAQVDTELPPRDLAVSEIDGLIDLATFAVRARSAVERDGYTRQVVVMPTPEAPSRLAGSLSTLLAGLESIGAPVADAWSVVSKSAWDCVPDARRRLLTAIRNQPDISTPRLVAATRIPNSTAAIVLEDMRLLELVDGRRNGDHDTASWSWSLSEETALTWPNAFHERAGN
jgi:hypothetical protein